MKLTPHAKRRVVLPLPIQKGDILLLDEQGHNQWLLTRSVRPKRAASRRFRRKSVADALAGSAGANIEIMEFKGQRISGTKL